MATTESSDDWARRVLEEATRASVSSTNKDSVQHITIPADQYFATKTELLAASHQIDRSIQEFRHAVEKLDSSIDARLAKSENRLLKWGIGIAIATGGLIIAILRYLSTN